MTKVYFVRAQESDGAEAVRDSFFRLLKKTDIFSFLRKGDKVAVKMHFGEDGNTGYVKPEYAKVLVKHIKEKGGEPVLTDTNALYRGRRTFTRDHMKLAREHGFTDSMAGAPVAIAEGDDGKDVSGVRIGQKFVKTAKIASLFCRADAIVSLAHFKGHLLTGFGGALKNLGMGCASREGKLEQHSDISPCVNSAACTGCGICEKACPAQVIEIIEGKAHIDRDRCIGCAECIAICPCEGISVDWETGKDFVQEKIAEYAKAALSGKESRAIFINFAIRINQECDCWTRDFPRIAPDVGILMSNDPVSVDKASMDMVIKLCGRDVFKEAHPNIDGFKQLHHAFRIGLGALEYELIAV